MNHRGIIYKIHIGLFFFLLIFVNLSVFAQVSINTTGDAPHSSAMLDISSVNSGLLIPRMSQAQRTAILSPAEGLLVYQTDIPAGLYQFRAVAWERYLPHTGTISAGQLIFGNNNNGLGQDNLLFWNNTDKRLGIGTSTPNVPLTVSSLLPPTGNGSGNSWIVSSIGAQTGSRVVLGTRDGLPTIGATNGFLTQWDTLMINPGGRIKLGNYTGTSTQLLLTNPQGVVRNATISNGITLQNDQVKIGGQLTETTSVSLANKTFEFNNGGVSVVNIDNIIPGGFFAFGPYAVGQSFTTNFNGVLDMVRTKIFSANGPYPTSYDIFEGNGYAGTLLQSGNFTMPYYNGDFDLAPSVDIPINMNVTASNVYTIRFNFNGIWTVGLTTGDTYAGGSFWTHDTNIPGYDLKFQLFVTEIPYSLFQIDGFNRKVSVNGYGSSLAISSLAGTGTRMALVSPSGVIQAGSSQIGTVTQVNATTPLSVTNPTTNPTISMTQANGTTNGFLSSTDWTTFNNKQNVLPNASASTSGILTSADWTTFNNKQNALPNASASTSGILTSTDWNAFNNKQNALPNASASASGILTSTDWTTFNNKQNALPNASASTSGILTSTDWTTFNNKQNVLPTFANGSVIFSNGTSLTQSSGQFHFDATNNRLGIGTNTPGKQLHINGSNGLRVFTDNPGSGFQNWIAGEFGGNVGNKVVIGLNDGVATIGGHSQNLNAWVNFAINPGGGNVGIGNNNPLAKLDVTGSTKFDGPSTINGNISHTGNTTHTGNVIVTGSLTVTAATSLSATTVNGNLSTTGDLTTNVINATTVKQGVISSPITLSPTSTGHVVLLHNRGYNPVIMCSLEQSAGGFLEYVSLSYEHVNNNEVKINFRNSAPFVASGTVHIIIVN